MKKTKIHLIGGIFSTIASIGLILYIAFAIGVVATAAKTTGQATNAIGAMAIGSILGYVLLAIGGVGSFVSGIIQVVKSGENPKKGIALTAGILNILGGVFFVGTAFSFVAHKAQN